MGNGNGNIALQVQKDEFLAAIEDLKSTSPPPECRHYGAVVGRALILILRCEAARSNARQVEAAENRAIRGAFWRTVTTKAVSVAIVLAAVGFLAIAVQAKPILGMLIELVK